MDLVGPELIHHGRLKTGKENGPLKVASVNRKAEFKRNHEMLQDVRVRGGKQPAGHGTRHQAHGSAETGHPEEIDAGDERVHDPLKSVQDQCSGHSRRPADEHSAGVGPPGEDPQYEKSDHGGGGEGDELE